MGNNVNKAIQKIKSAIKIFITQTLIHALTTVLPYILIAVFVASIGLVILDWAREWIDGKNTADKIEEVLSIQDINELIEIKGNDENGYYWGFVDDIDDRLDVLIEKMKSDPDVVTIEDKDMLKKMIKAELVTQYPDLGGKTFATGDTYTGTSAQKAEILLDEMSIDQKISQLIFLNTSDSNSLSKNAGGYILSTGFDFANSKSIIENANNDYSPVFAAQEEGRSWQYFYRGISRC